MMKRTVVLTFLCIIVMFFCIESIGFEKEILMKKQIFMYLF